MSLWLKSLVGYMLIVSVVTKMLPNSKYEQYVRLFTGFLLIVLVLQPVLKMGSVDSFLEAKIQEFVQEQESLEIQIGVETEKFQQESKQLQTDRQEIVIREIEKISVEVTGDDEET